MSSFSVTLSPPRPQHRDLGVLTWNLHDFKDGKFKRSFIESVFEKNPWLTLLGIQEASPDDNLQFENLTCVKPIELVAVTPRDKKPKSNKSKSFDLDGVLVTPSQREVYPLLFRKQAGIEVQSCFAYYDRKVYNDKTFYWCKPLKWRKGWKKLSKRKRELIVELNGRRPKWRPIIVYVLNVWGMRFCVGIVHTTPRGQGLGRGEEYEQIESLLDYVKTRTGEAWIILGDYYLDPEASTDVKVGGRNRVSEELFKNKVAKKGLSVIASISATNQSRVASSVLAKKDQTHDSQGRVVVNKRADMIVVNSKLAKRPHVAGIMNPKGTLLRIDPEHNALNWWRNSSDHVPMAVVFCLTDMLKRHCQLSELCEVSPELQLLASEDLAKRRMQSLKCLCECLSGLSYRLLYSHGKAWGKVAVNVKQVCGLIYFTLMSNRVNSFVLYQVAEWVKLCKSEKDVMGFIENMASQYARILSKYDRKVPREIDGNPMVTLARICMDVRKHLNVLEQGLDMYDPVAGWLTYGEDPNPVVFQYDGLNVTRQSRKTLQPGGYLDDAVISVWYRKLSGSLSGQFALIPPGLAYMIAMAVDVRAARDQLTHAIGDSRWVFLPINDNRNPNKVGGSHWTLLIWDRTTNHFVYLDTLNGVGSPGLQLVSRIRQMKSLAGCSFKQRKAPQQFMPDCGIYVLSLTEHIANAICSQARLDDRFGLFRLKFDPSEVEAPSKTRERILKWMHEKPEQETKKRKRDEKN